MNLVKTAILFKHLMNLSLVSSRCSFWTAQTSSFYDLSDGFDQELRVLSKFFLSSGAVTSCLRYGQAEGVGKWEDGEARGSIQN
jgi:hypothetical protein